MHAQRMQRMVTMLVSYSEVHPKFRGISGWMKGWSVDGHVIKEGLNKMLVVKSSWKRHECSLENQHNFYVYLYFFCLQDGEIWTPSTLQQNLPESGEIPRLIPYRE